MLGLCQDTAVLSRVSRESFCFVRGDSIYCIKEDIRRQINESAGSSTQAHPVCYQTVLLLVKTVDKLG